MTLETQAAFARRLGKDRAHVTRLKAAGRLVMQAGRVVVEETLPLLDATASPLPVHAAKTEALAQARAERAVAASQRPEADESGEDLASIGRQMKVQTLLWQRAKAEIAAMERDKMAGALVERAKLDFLLADYGSLWRTTLESLPDRLAPAIAAHRGDVAAIHAELESVFGDVLHELVEHLARRLAQAKNE